MSINYLTHNNYFTTSGHGKDWTVNLKPVTQSPNSWLTESIRSAQLIKESATSPLVLLFSGGLDSEYMLNVFKYANYIFFERQFFI